MHIIFFQLRIQGSKRLYKIRWPGKLHYVNGYKNDRKKATGKTTDSKVKYYDGENGHLSVRFISHLPPKFPLHPCTSPQFLLSVSLSISFITFFTYHFLSGSSLLSSTLPSSSFYMTKGPPLTVLISRVEADLLYLGVGDVLVGGEEKHHLPLLVLDGHDVQEAPERRTWNGKEEDHE